MCVAKSNERKVRNRRVMKNKVLFLTYGGKFSQGKKKKKKKVTSDIMKKANNE